ncbi:MAG: glycosyl transferase [Bacteroidetes bacterium HGW-Bacteroidetes-9]|jgi:SAM-dependent methyltransferase|nr:MAG: glycosyl transferase [Bacteroidetes bacterium HGW-Bacteroidetes-9]
MNSISENKQRVLDGVEQIAHRRYKFIRQNLYYYKNLISFCRFNIPEGSRVLEVGCGTGYLLNAIKPSYGMGIDFSPSMINLAKEKYPHLNFKVMDAENISLTEAFDYIVISDTLGYLEDIQQAFKELKKVIHPGTRIIITYHSFLWEPLLWLAQKLGLKMPHRRLNWLNRGDVINLLELENYDVVKSGRRFIFPVYIPILSWFLNKYIAYLPLFNSLCLTGFIIGRLPDVRPHANRDFSVSVIIPARNEMGNIEDAVIRTPDMGKHTEIIFVEGNSTDETLKEIKRVCEAYKDKRDVKWMVQEGKGKGDAVRKGYDHATGDILMILDADLTVPPEDLPKFYDAIATGKGEYINGTRLVYPMEDEAMRTLNMMGNKFFSVMFSWLLGQRLKDTLCGTKVLTAENYRKLAANRSYFGNFDPFGDFDLIFGSAKLNLKLVEVPIRYRARKYGDTNISRFKHGWLLLKMVAYAMNKIKFVK